MVSKRSHDCDCWIELFAAMENPSAPAEQNAQQGSDSSSLASAGPSVGAQGQTTNAGETPNGGEIPARACESPDSIAPQSTSSAADSAPPNPASSSIASSVPTLAVSGSTVISSGPIFAVPGSTIVSSGPTATSSGAPVACSDAVTISSGTHNRNNSVTASPNQSSFQALAPEGARTGTDATTPTIQPRSAKNMDNGSSSNALVANPVAKTATKKKTTTKAAPTSQGEGHATSTKRKQDDLADKDEKNNQPAKKRKITRIILVVDGVRREREDKPKWKGPCCPHDDSKITRIILVVDGVRREREDKPKWKRPCCPHNDSNLTCEAGKNV